MLDDPRFATARVARGHARELIAILDEIFATKDHAEWRAILDAAGLIFGIVAEMDEIADDAQILASEALVPFADGSTLTVNSPFWVAGQEKVKTAPRSCSRRAQRRGVARKRATPMPRSRRCAPRA